MAEYLAQNLVEVTLASSGINSSQTTIPLASGEGARLASTSGSDYQYPLVIYDTRYRTPQEAFKNSKAEIVLVTSHDGASDTISVVTRAQESTTAIAHNTTGVTYKAVAGFTKAMFDDLLGSGVRDFDTTSSSLFVGGRKVYYPDISSRLMEQTSGTFEAYSFGANRFEHHLFIPEKSGTIDELMIVAATASQTATCRMALYESTSRTSLYPSARLFESGSISPSDLQASTNARWVSDPSAARVTKGRVYVLSAWFNGAVSLNGYSNLHAQFIQLAGYDWQSVSILERLGTANGTDAGIGTSGFPDPFTSGLTFTWATNRPVFWIHWAT